MPRTPGQTHDDHAAAYPAQRVFVIKLQADAHPAHGACRGRLEHVLTGRQQPFATAAELLSALDHFDIAPPPSPRKTP